MNNGDSAKSKNLDQENYYQNLQILGLDLHIPVFPVSAGIIILFVAYALVFQEHANNFFSDVRHAITINLDWLFMIAANVFLLFCIYLIFSPLGNIRIGGKDTKPNYSRLSWFAMMFAAGVGIGLMFYGVLEPVTHMLSPPLKISPGSQEAPTIGLAAANYHWGLHAWGIYSVVGISLAISHYNKGLPLTIRYAFHSLFGDHVSGILGDVIDILAVFATLFGLATSLGLGAQQVAGGLDHIFGIANTGSTKVVIVLIITSIAIISVIRGMDRGVKLLSEINIALAFALFVFVLIASPTGDVIISALQSFLDYAVYLIPLSNPMERTDTMFYRDWTIFYWAWWIAWSPFVGMFIARVSKGRTVREFMICALLVPSTACILWMSVFGGSAFLQYFDQGYLQVIKAVQESSIELSLFRFLEFMPYSKITSVFALLLIIIFFVTSMDSGSLVIDTITAGGKIDAHVSQRVFWCTFEGLTAIALLLGGGLTALQAASLITGLPFLFVLLLMIISLRQGLLAEPK